MPCSPIGLHGFLFSYWDWIRNEVYCILLLVYIWVYYNRKNEKCNFEKRKIHFLRFFNPIPERNFTAVKSLFKRHLIV